MSDASELLAAGAVLPLGSEGAGEQAVPLAARRYRHPALDGRVVVRLAPVELGEGEDQAAGFLGMERLGEPRMVGIGQRAALGFPEWVLAHRPQDGHHALAVVPELERITQRAKTRPKAALDAFHELAGRLASSAPHLLPTYYERAAREFLEIGNAVYAAQLFNSARDAEAEHGLPIDEERLDAVFLEFMLSGALPVKAISGYAKGLAARVPADEALRRFTLLCVRRTESGLTPSGSTAADLRRLAKAAGENAEAVEHAYLTELLALPATKRAAMGWWKTHRPALASLAERRPEFLGALLNMMPVSEEGTAAVWLELLKAAGAFAVLSDPDGAPEEARPKDGSTCWLERFLGLWGRQGYRDRLPALFPLVESMAGRLRAELSASGAEFDTLHHLDLLDLMLALGIPVAVPPWYARQRLDDWARGEDRRDLLAAAADPRFRADFHRAADELRDDEAGLHALRVLLATPGGRPLIADWAAEVARRTTAAGLPDTPRAVNHLGRLPVEVLALAEDAVRAAAAEGLAPSLRRTLRAGLLDELGWPAWEKALEELADVGKPADVLVADAWPHLIVADRTRARVIGAEGTVLVHDLRIPHGDPRNDLGFQYVDGELLVHWRSRRSGDGFLGYWHTEADRHLPLEGRISPAQTLARRKEENGVGLPLPGGGRATGAGTLRRGDTVLPESRPVISDGTSYWVWKGRAEGGLGWHEYDAASGESGRESMPGFFADAARDVPGGSFFTGSLLPVPGIGATPAGTPVNGLLGLRVVRLPEDVYRGEDLAGNTVTAPMFFAPFGVLFLPGDDRPRAVTNRNRRELELFDTDGVIMSAVKTDGAPGAFAEGTALLPPARYWHCMRPRDPRGSAALRGIDEEAAASLIQAAMGGGDLSEAVRGLLPDVTHEALIAGVAGVVRHAAAQQRALGATAERMEEAVAQEAVPEEGAAGPAELLVKRALNGLGHQVYEAHWDGEPRLFVDLQALTRAASGVFAVPAPEGRPALPKDGVKLHGSDLWQDSLLESRPAMAYRAVSEITDPEHREALRALLRALDELGLTPEGASRWRRFHLHLDMKTLHPPVEGYGWGDQWSLLPLGDGAFLLIRLLRYSTGRDADMSVLFHDPAGRFDVPAHYTVRSSEPLAPPANSVGPAGFLAEAAGRGPVPWSTEAAAEFARLTGVTEATARLVVAGLPWVDREDRNFLPPGTRAALGLKAADAAAARDELRASTPRFRRALVGALLPADPARLWTEGPDVAAAAELWNTEVGRRVAVPQAITTEANRMSWAGWESTHCLAAVLDPASEPRLSRDVKWTVRNDHVAPEDGDAVGLTGETLLGAVAMTAWLAHRLPAGDALRERLPAALEAVRARLADPGLTLGFGERVDLAGFREKAGPPTEDGAGYQRYGALVMPAGSRRVHPAVRPSLLDEPGNGLYLEILRDEIPDLRALEPMVLLVRDERFAALLADPGDPAAGERSADGTWWPQDPARSVPDLVAEAASRHGLGADAAAVYLMLLAMPDPTDQNTARWTGWKPARLKAARAELAKTSLVVEADRTGAGRSLFLPGGWSRLPAPLPSLEEWKLPLFPLVSPRDASSPLGAAVPTEPAADLYRRAWRRVTEDDGPRFAELRIR
ncbi:DNA-binding protein [Actinocorallia libanotica]|uniref:DNA-binding protein n=1 Tax=Actinocorallia libanotica TaxID=46162 RepID=A0ABP4AJ47_9ACTN